MHNFHRKMEKYSWPDAVKTKIKECTENMEVCRAKLGYVDKADAFQVDSTWKAAWPESAAAFLFAIETRVSTPRRVRRT